jgi:RimJ/RimL family protein N-acetyltransferase
VSAFAEATIGTQRLLLTPCVPRTPTRWSRCSPIRDSTSSFGGRPATLTCHHGSWIADIAWVIGLPFQHQGYASEAARALVGWLGGQDVGEIVAHIHPDHLASARVAIRAGFQPTDDQVDGEQVWRILTRR